VNIILRRKKKEEREKRYSGIDRVYEISVINVKIFSQITQVLFEIRKIIDISVKEKYKKIIKTSQRKSWIFSFFDSKDISTNFLI